MTLEILSALVIEAYQAQQDKRWGAITQLSKQYQTSRTFIYSLLSHFKSALGHLVFPEGKPDAVSMADIEAQRLAQRFEGRASIDAISTLRRREGQANDKEKHPWNC